MQLVGYLEAVTEALTIDLITVSAYQIEGSQVVVPQRVDPEQTTNKSVAVPSSPSSAGQGQYVEGTHDFEAAITTSAADHQPLLYKLTNWAKDLERQGLVKLGTYHGVADRLTLLPRLHADNVGLVTIWNDNGPILQFWRSVIERRAPLSLERIEHLAHPAKVRQGTSTKVIRDDLLEALTAAYQEAASGTVVVDKSIKHQGK